MERTIPKIGQEMSGDPIGPPLRQHIQIRAGRDAIVDLRDRRSQKLCRAVLQSQQEG